MTHIIHQGDSALTLKQYPNDHFDSIITDPPYGIEFLGKDWDKNTGAIEIWQECLRVLKPGGFLLAFSAARTYHHLATRIESVGFDIRDQIMWIYASGFPKAQDIGKSIQKRLGVKQTKSIPKEQQTNTAGFANNGAQEKTAWSGQQTVCTDPEALKWSGWKTALKPAHEPIVMARKPFTGSTTDNVLTHGVGALNIDASRIPYEHKDTPSAGDRTASFSFGDKPTHAGGDGSPPFAANEQGRFPSNVLGDIPDYQKYFYSPKVSRRERHCGFDAAPSVKSMLLEMGAAYIDSQGRPVPYEQRGNNPQILIPGVGVIYTHGLKDEYAKWCAKTNKNNRAGKTATGLTDRNGNVQTFTSDPATHRSGNNHPTVKPVALMRYLIQLVTPPNSRVLDPFCGSGSTGMAARELGHEFVGSEQDPRYVAIANRRIEGWLKHTEQHTHNPTHRPAPFERLFE